MGGIPLFHGLLVGVGIIEVEDDTFFGCIDFVDFAWIAPHDGAGARFVWGREELIVKPARKDYGMAALAAIGRDDNSLFRSDAFKFQYERSHQRTRNKRIINGANHYAVCRDAVERPDSRLNRRKLATLPLRVDDD